MCGETNNENFETRLLGSLHTDALKQVSCLALSKAVFRSQYCDPFFVIHYAIHNAKL